MRSKDINEHNCPICRSVSIHTIYTAAHDYITDEYFQIVGCDDCKIVYTSPQPENMSSYYPEEYRKYNPTIYKILEFLYTKRAQRWSNHTASTGTAFEVGCGNGIMLHTLHKHGWTVLGNERTVDAAKFARHTFNLPVYVGGIDSLVTMPFVDVAILFQVLEHLTNPIQTLQQLSVLLKPNGKIVIAVPNFGGWQAKFGGEKWFHLDVPRHLFHFSYPSLEFCLKKAGLEITNVNYVSFEHDPYGWIQTLLNQTHQQHNRLTKFLMGFDKPSMGTLYQIALAILLSFISSPLSVLSWLFNKGAIIEVTARKSNIKIN